MQGWIKLHRKMIKWGWYQKSEMVHLFLHFLLLANHDKNEWQGNVVNRGQCITGLKSLHKDTGISVQTLRTCIDRLKSTGEITSKSTNKFRLITLLNYNDYQIKDDKLTGKLTTKLTNNQQTTNKQLTSNKNDKNEKKNIAIKDCIEFSSNEYIKELLNSDQRHKHIIGLFWEFKDKKFDSREEANSLIPRQCKIAKALKPFSDEKILAGFDEADRESNFDKKYVWSLETIHKRLGNI